MTNFEERQLLLEGARELRESLRKFNEQINPIINQLLTEADALLPKAANEIQAGTPTSVRKLNYAKFEGEIERKHGGKKNLERQAAIIAAHSTADTLKEMSPKPKRILSEARKAQLRETLKKARAAKGKK